jgi:hypothetical protein
MYLIWFIKLVILCSVNKIFYKDIFYIFDKKYINYFQEIQKYMIIKLITQGYDFFCLNDWTKKLS